MSDQLCSLDSRWQEWQNWSAEHQHWSEHGPYSKRSRSNSFSLNQHLQANWNCSTNRFKHTWNDGAPSKGSFVVSDGMIDGRGASSASTSSISRSTHPPQPIPIAKKKWGEEGWEEWLKQSGYVQDATSIWWHPTMKSFPQYYILRTPRSRMT